MTCNSLTGKIIGIMAKTGFYSSYDNPGKYPMFI